MTKNKNKYYAWVLPGGESGVCESWEECQKHCSGCRGEKHKSFKTYEEAFRFAFPGVSMPEASIEKASSAEALSEALNIAASGGEAEPLASEELKSAASDAILKKVIDFCEKYEFTKLSEVQMRAVQSTEGKVLLFAAPGSGKTTVIIARTGYMVHALNIHPASLMSLTFTKAAALEMKERYCRHFNTKTAPEFRTIHSLCYSVILPWLKRSGFSVPGHIIGEEIPEETDVQNRPQYHPAQIFRQVFKKMKFSPADFEMAMEASSTLITGIKNSMTPRAEYEGHMLKLGGQEVSAAKIFDTYQEILKQLDCMDFDDLLLYSLDGLRQLPQVLNGLRRKYAYWSIDEAQDNSQLQSSLLDLITGEDGNLFMVGDDDQSIYSYRGANPGLLIAFGQRADVKTLKMEVNYRSDSAIINAAKTFIEENVNRAPKALESFSEASGKVIIPGILKTEAEQYYYIVQAAKEALQNNQSLAVLYRRNISSLPLMVHLHKHGIGYESNRAIRDILQSKPIKTICEALKLAVNPSSWSAFSSCQYDLGISLSKEAQEDVERILRTNPNAEVLSVIEEKYAQQNADGSKDEAIANIKKVSAALGRIRQMLPGEAVCFILEELYGFSPEGIGDRLSVYSILSACDAYNTVAEFAAAMEELSQEEENPGENKSLVTLSSMHYAKGREFDRVIIIDSFDDIMPGTNNDNSLIYDQEEERRLFYVAATRAIHELDILTVDKYHGNSEIISSFVTEFAQIAEGSGSDSAPLNDIDIKELRSTAVIFKPSKYYAVKAGRKPGVYTTWADCQEQILRYSNADFKAFATLVEAKEYVGLPEDINISDLKTELIEDCFIGSRGVAFNYPMDLPEPINRAVHDYYKVRSLTELSDKKIKTLYRNSNLFQDNQSTDYSASAESYMILYMPLNYYKVWEPLKELIYLEVLPVNCRILELGAGPGTATLGIISFYSLLAADNPDIRFSLDITSVEREKSFEPLYMHLTEAMIKQLPVNLKVKTTFVNADAFSYTPAKGQLFDMLLESNMINVNEDVSDNAVNRFLSVMNASLRPGGLVVMIEPGTTGDKKQLRTIGKLSESDYNAVVTGRPKISAVDVSGITLYKEAIEIKLRFQEIKMHWFSWMLLEYGVDE